jgi:hypothetical protein
MLGKKYQRDRGFRACTCNRFFFGKGRVSGLVGMVF